MEPVLLWYDKLSKTFRTGAQALDYRESVIAVPFAALPRADYEALVRERDEARENLGRLLDYVEGYCQMSEIDTGGTVAEEWYGEMKAEARRIRALLPPPAAPPPPAKGGGS
jgi:hypothetical protein